MTNARIVVTTESGIRIESLAAPRRPRRPRFHRARATSTSSTSLALPRSSTPSVSARGLADRGLEELEGQGVRVDSCVDAERQWEVRAGVAEVDVGDDRDVPIGHEVEHDLAKGFGCVRLDRDRLDRTDEQAGDAVEHARRAEDLEVVPDVDRRRVQVLEEEDRAVESV